MKTIYGLVSLREKISGAVVSIGVFDGVHRGHRYLIGKAVSAARRIKKKSVCITFDPHPQGLPYLISLKHRLKLICSLGIDFCAVMNFNKKFSEITAEEFIEGTLVKFFRPSHIIVGKSFRFGCGSLGDVKLLKREGKRFGFKVYPVNELKAGKRVISSNGIRSLIRRGDFFLARALLGRRVSVLGTVIKGSKRGRLLGYPTANIDLHHEVIPPSGVYAVKVEYKKITLNGICNIGSRPTFHYGEDSQTIEAYLFDFRKNIYSEDVEIQFISKIRDERKFATSSSLVGQIAQDSIAARRILEAST